MIVANRDKGREFMAFRAIMKRPACRAAIVAFAAAVATPSIASAQDGDGRDRVITVGLGAQVGPKHLGSDGYSVFPLPFGKIRRPEEPMPYSASDDSPGIRLVRGENFSIGPTFNFRAKRRESDVGAAVGDIKVGLEPGIFVEAYATPAIRLRGEARIGINGHDGLVGDLAVDYILRSADQKLVMGVGPRARFGDGEFEGRYFGVAPDVALRTGLNAYAPDGGLYAVGLQASGHYQLDDRWGVYGQAGYDRLVGAGDESPIVRNFGSENQFYAGVAATYTFDLRL